ncbi:MAG: orotidine-5'-phosphate decarboxylase [Deltaproteobacteria bacterium]|nr:orotidine-5'-phosphate decarboxylase [Deltaproteobacteria bacterium]MBF0523799.1 orotidine-5'-phosphate decarboxylase [Deltaproteobacteria bacterium]
MDPRNRICVALDVDDCQKARDIVALLKNEVGLFKVGFQLFTNPDSSSFLDELVGMGVKVFLDLKIHDIPNTALNAAKNLVKRGVYMFNVHASGGGNMLRATAQATAEEADKLGLVPPVVLAVTVLTSIDNQTLKTELNVGLSVEEQVVSLARLANQSGLDGVVASPRETKLIKAACGADFIVLTPGIRPAWSVKNDDQKRVTTPRQAVQNGSDFIVIGRPIIEAPDPLAAVSKIISELSE